MNASSVAKMHLVLSCKERMFFSETQCRRLLHEMPAADR